MSESRSWSNRGQRWLVCTGGAMILSACVSSCGGPTSAEASPSAAPPDLRHVFITQLPRRFVLASESESNSGPTDLEKQATADLLPDAKARLSSDGFVAGYVRVWQMSSNQPMPSGERVLETALVINLYEFATPTGANAYMKARSSTGRAVTSSLAPIESAFALPSPPGGNGFESTSQVRYDRVTFTKGDYLVSMTLEGTAANAGLERELASAQWKSLP